MKLNRLSKTEFHFAKELLKDANLPFEDIYAENISLFELTHKNETIAIGGFEYYGNNAIIRSIAVIPSKQLKGTGSFLVNELENIAIEEGIKRFFLLTTTAENFFKKKDYHIIKRESAPDTIQGSAEFKSICPESAICMTKDLTKKFVPKILEVDKELNLKQLELSDADAIFEIIDSQRKYLGEWLPFVAHTHTVEDPKKYIKGTMDVSNNENEFVFAIKYKNKTVGLVGFKQADNANKKIEIGYWLSEKFQKRGIMRRCVNRMIEFAFYDLELNRIQIKCAVGNEKSINIPKYFGFTYEGKERDGELFPDGSFVDIKVFSLLKGEFKPKE